MKRLIKKGANPIVQKYAFGCSDVYCDGEMWQRPNEWFEAMKTC